MVFGIFLLHISYACTYLLIKEFKEVRHRCTPLAMSEKDYKDIAVKDTKSK